MGRRAGADRNPGEGVREDHADARARVEREPHLRADGPLSERGEPERPEGHERRGRGREGRERPAGLQRGTGHLGHRDRPDDGAEHGIHVRDALGLQHRRRDRAAHRPSAAEIVAQVLSASPHFLIGDHP